MVTTFLPRVELQEEKMRRDPKNQVNQVFCLKLLGKH